MIKIAVVGDIGSGKSHIAKLFGYPVFNADQEVASIYKENKDCFKRLKKNLPKYFSVFPANKIQIIKAIEDSEKNLKKITKNTRVIMPVHLYGSVARIDDIKKIIKNKKIFLIDDCSQAHGAIYNGKKVGSLGDISCFSLYPGKNLGAYGDAGIITTNNKILYNKIKNFRNLGSDIKFIHTQVGFNSRLDTIQAAILLRKIKFPPFEPFKVSVPT